MALDLSANIKVNFDVNATDERILKRIQLVQKRLDAQIMKDSNYYCPMYTGTLQKSVITSSVIGSGVLVWNTPYAKAQYYGLENKYLLKNPNARTKWFEAAKATKLEQWVKLANDTYYKSS